MLKKILSASLAFMMMSTMLVGCDNDDRNNAEPSSAAPDNTVPADTAVPADNGVSYVNEAGMSYPISLLSSGMASTAAEFDPRIAEANNAFAITMLKAFDKEGSFVCSPLSLSIALKVLANGGDEETSRILLNAVCPGITREEVNFCTEKLISMLTKNEDISINSAVIVDRNMRLCEKFANIAADHYRASVGALDFSDPETALAEINGWVEKNTDGLIKELLDEVGADTSIVILNALTMKLDWAKPFTAMRELTEFNGVNGKEYVGMIQSAGDYGYGEFYEGRMALIPYAGGDYAMAVVLPNEGFTPSEALSALISRIDDCDTADVFVKMPKAELDSRFDILKAADSLGIGEGVRGRYPGLVDSSSVIISQLVHGATLSVTEYGTTATAATAVVGRKSIPRFSAENELICNRPYAMAIYHVETGAVLFVSVVSSIG